MNSRKILMIEASSNGAGDGYVVTPLVAMSEQEVQEILWQLISAEFRDSDGQWPDGANDDDYFVNGIVNGDIGTPVT